MDKYIGTNSTNPIQGGRGDMVCEHLLAVRLALAMQRNNVETVPDKLIILLIDELVDSMV